MWKGDISYSEIIFFLLFLNIKNCFDNEAVQQNEFNDDALLDIQRGIDWVKN